MTTRSIGFLDYNLDNYHANVFVSLIHKDLAARGWRVERCHAADEKSGRAWAEANGVRYAATLDDLRDCDGFMILAPSNPEVHLDMARRLFRFGKPVYVDKTFAPDFATARKIFQLGDRHDVPVITSSALRCCASLDRVLKDLGGRDTVRHMSAWSPGRSFEEYAVHPIEMIVSVMGHAIRRVRCDSDGAHHQFQFEYAGGRTANVVLHLESKSHYQAVVSTRESSVHVDVNADPFFKDLCGLVLDFFEAGKEIIDRRQSLAIARVRDLVSNRAARGRWLKV